MMVIDVFFPWREENLTSLMNIVFWLNFLNSVCSLNIMKPSIRQWSTSVAFMAQLTLGLYILTLCFMFTLFTFQVNHLNNCNIKIIVSNISMLDSTFLEISSLLNFLQVNLKHYKSLSFKDCISQIKLWPFIFMFIHRLKI